jgi:hypothetical protein
MKAKFWKILQSAGLSKSLEPYVAYRYVAGFMVQKRTLFPTSLDSTVDTRCLVIATEIIRDRSFRKNPEAEISDDVCITEANLRMEMHLE